MISLFHAATLLAACALPALADSEPLGQVSAALAHDSTRSSPNLGISFSRGTAAIQPELLPIPDSDEWTRAMRARMTACETNELLLSTAVERRDEWRRLAFERRKVNLERKYLAISDELGQAAANGRNTTGDLALEERIAAIEKSSIAESLRCVDEEVNLIRTTVEQAQPEAECWRNAIAVCEELIRDRLAALGPLLLPVPRQDIDRAFKQVSLSWPIEDDSSTSSYRERRLALMKGVLRGYPERLDGGVELAIMSSISGGRGVSELTSEEHADVEAAAARLRTAFARAGTSQAQFWSHEWEWFTKARAALPTGSQAAANQLLAFRFMPAVYPCPFLETSEDDAARSPHALDQLAGYREQVASALLGAERQCASYTANTFSQVWLGPNSDSYRQFARSMRDARGRMCEAAAGLWNGLPENERGEIAKAIPALEAALTRGGTRPIWDFNTEWPPIRPGERKPWFVATTASTDH
jgi:hypothetical protein